MHSRHDSERSDAFISQFKKKEREKKKTFAAGLVSLPSFEVNVGPV